jgi:hypothetical protein
MSPQGAVCTVGTSKAGLYYPPGLQPPTLTVPGRHAGPHKVLFAHWDDMILDHSQPCETSSACFPCTWIQLLELPTLAKHKTSPPGSEEVRSMDTRGGVWSPIPD